MQEITINDLPYLINIDKAIELGVLKKKKIIKAGDYYRSDRLDVYQLIELRKGSSSFYEATLIREGGTVRWCDPTPVKDPLNISQEEWNKITYGRAFIKVAATITFE